MDGPVKKRIRHLKWRLARWWDVQRAPWPIVSECHKSYIPEHACEQCEPTHIHIWVAWPAAPAWITGGPGIPVRCKVCGARKCDFDNCDSRRHDHVHVDGLALPHLREPRHA